MYSVCCCFQVIFVQAIHPFAFRGYDPCSHSCLKTRQEIKVPRSHAIGQNFETNLPTPSFFRCHIRFQQVMLHISDARFSASPRAPTLASLAAGLRMLPRRKGATLHHRSSKMQLQTKAFKQNPNTKHTVFLKCLLAFKCT